MIIEMKVLGLTMDPSTSSPIVILRDEMGKRSLPIWIGIMEASAIAMELQKVKFVRPLTHDLIKNILESLNATINKIVVNDLRDNTYYATIFIKIKGDEFQIDSRPSDAIAIALRTESPIFVEEQVIAKSLQMEMTKDGLTEEEIKKKWAELLESLPPEDFGKYKM
ncbi:MAG TPA: bifunctional nuclease family protein [bacterium]